MIRSGITPLLLFVFVGTGLALECFVCDSREKTFHNECDNGYHSLPTEICTQDQQCYNGTYSWSPDGRDYYEISIRGCGPIMRECEAFLKYKQRKIGFNLIEKQCVLCNTDKCNDSTRLTGYYSLTFLSALFVFYNCII